MLSRPAVGCLIRAICGIIARESRRHVERETNAALFVGHPGHELRVFGWLGRARPTVHVLTDGGGRDGQSRLASTSALLERMGLAPGRVYGRLSDARFYEALLAGDANLFVGLADELAGALVDGRVDLVAGDAAEGYNPAHDLCRAVLDAAVAIAARATGRAIANLHLPLAAAPSAPATRVGAIRLDLDDAEFEAKLAAIAEYRELEGEAKAVFAEFGCDAFRVEWLAPAATAEPHEIPPFYERHGERRVASGYYRHVIRYREHVRPVVDALGARARGASA
jgi:hypothetical protein